MTEHSQHLPRVKDPPLGRVVGFFASTNLISSGLRLAGALLTSRFVDPSVLGRYNGIGLVQGYAPFLQLGVSNGLMRDLPLFVGKGEKERADVLAAASQWWAIFISSVSGVVLFAIGVGHAVRGNWEGAVGWWSFIAGVTFALLGQQHLRALFRTGGDFMKLARIQLIDGVVALALVTLVWWLGWWGLCARGFSVAALGLALMWWMRPLRVRARIDRGALMTLARVGIPIFLVGNLLAWWATLNSTLVLSYAGKTGLGLYAVANMTGPVLFLLPQALNSVIYPRMAMDYGESGRIRRLVSMAVKPMLVTAAVTACAVCAAWVAIPVVVPWLLPKYVEGIPAAQWAAAAVWPMALGAANSVFPVTGALGRYGVAIGGGMAAYALFLNGLMSDGIDLVDFSKALLAGRAVFIVICFSLIAHMVLIERRRVVEQDSEP